MKKMNFTKAVATGNDFIIVDNRSGAIKSFSSLAKRLCRPKHAVGADGILAVERSKKADFKMRIINSDGSEAEMCGNGSRCAALYAFRKAIAGSAMTIETLAGILKASVRGDVVKVMLTEPKDIRWNFCLMIHKCPYKVSFVNTGVPHVIHFVDDLESIDVRNIGSHMRNHGEFAPAGTNADFVKVDNEKTISVRTYERGVEDETLACGTGSVASALIAAEAEKMSSPVTVVTRSGEKLKVHFDLIKGNYKNVYLEGKAKLVYEGVLYEV